MGISAAPADGVFSNFTDAFKKFLANTGGARLLSGGILATETARETTTETIETLQELNPIEAAASFMQRGLLMILSIVIMTIGFYFILKSGVVNET